MTKLIQTYTGRLVNPLNMGPEDIAIHDIAHSLSLQCRYGGHCSRFYSVAEHSVLVSEAVPQEHARHALLHDAVEAYLTDIPRPLKPKMPEYRMAEDRLEWQLFTYFGVNPTRASRDWVERADYGIVLDESLALMANYSHFVQRMPGATPLGVEIKGNGPLLSEANFLMRFMCLFPEYKGD